MEKKYMEVKIFVAGAGDTDHIYVQSDSLDGEKGVVRLSIENGKDEKIIGYFNIDQLMNAIDIVRTSDIPYTSFVKAKK